MNKNSFKKGSESSSELSANENSEEESNSFIIQKKKKLKKCSFKQKYLETSPNKRFGRYEEKKFSEINHTAYLGIDHDRGCDVLWNVINVSGLSNDNKQILLSEFNKFKNLHHENVSALIDFWEKDNNTVIFITDYFTSGSIRQYLMKIGKQKLKVVKSWMKMILCGLEYLHKQEVFLRNLNCGRIFYNGNNGIVSIGEIYMASKMYQKIFYDNINTSLDSEKFMINCQAPEILNKSGITDKSDIYSLGMVLIEMLSLEIPFNQIHSQIKIREKIIDGFKPITIEKISDNTIILLLDRLLEYDSNKRPTIQELFSEEFLKINEKDDNRIVPIVKLKKKTKRFSTLKNTSNFLQNNNVNYITTPYQSAVPDDYLMSSSNQIFRQQTEKDFPQLQYNESFFNSQKAYVNQKHNKNNFSLTLNNFSNLKVNSTLNNIHDLSHERHKRPGMHNVSKKINSKKLVLFKHKFEENPYFEESLKLKIENEFEKNNNNSHSHRAKNNQNLNESSNFINKDSSQLLILNNDNAGNLVKDPLENTTPASKLNRDPTFFLNQNNNLTANEQIKEYLNNKTNSIIRKNKASAADDLEDNNFENNRNNTKYISEFNQTYPDNLSAIQSNCNRETLYNYSSQGLTNRNSNNTISGFIENNNLNSKSQNSNNFYNSCENQNNGFNNLTPKSNGNDEINFARNLANSNKEAESRQNKVMSINDSAANNEGNDVNKNEIKKKKNKSVSWMNFDNKIYDVIGSYLKNEPNKDQDFKADNNDNNQDKELNVFPQFYSSENLNQIIEKVISNNFDPIFGKYGIPSEIKKNKINQVKNNKRKKSSDYQAIDIEDDILHESNSNTNNGNLKYSKDSSSLIDSDNLMDESNKNDLLINNLSNFSSEKNTNINDNNNNNIDIFKESKENANHLYTNDYCNNINYNENKNIFEPSHSQSNLRSIYLEKEILHFKTKPIENFLRTRSESANNILNYDNYIKHNSNKQNESERSFSNNANNDLDILINENQGQIQNENQNAITTTNKISSNNSNGFYNVRNSSSDSLTHFNTIQNKKDLAQEEEEYADLANKDAADDFNENLNNNNNNNDNLYNKPKYQIFDSNYDVHLKFMINQDSKIHEIQFTYNLLKDNIPDLMAEIQNEFNFSSENLNHIYETLKKISIYSKFYCNSDILHDNSF